jgi:type I restriction enzyme S subunit
MEVRPGYKQTALGVIPEDWEVDSVGDSFDVCNHLRLPISQTVRERMIGPYPYYGPTGVQGWINEYRVEGEYALIGEDGDHFLKWNSQPMTLLVRGKFNVNNHAHLVRGSKNLTDWFYWFFANRDLTPFLTRQGAGRYKLTKASLLHIPCALPSKPEQRAISAALSDVDALIVKLEQLIAKKRDLKQAAVQQLLTGQIRLPGFQVNPGYKQTEVGVIPEDWSTASLDSCLDLLTDFEANGSFESVAANVQVVDSENFAWYVRATDLENGSKPEGIRYVTERSYKFLKKTALYGGEVLITKRGEIGKVYLFEKKTAFATLAPNLYLLKLNATVLPKYVFDYFRYGNGNQTLKNINASTTLGALYKNDVKAIIVPLPSIPEQTAIATVLSDMDTEIAALEARREKTRALKQGMMQELLTGRIRLA